MNQSQYFRTVVHGILTRFMIKDLLLENGNDLDLGLRTLKFLFQAMFHLRNSHKKI